MTDDILDTMQDLIINGNKIYTKTTILSFEKTMDKYYKYSNSLAEHILIKAFGDEYFYNYIMPFFIDDFYIYSESILPFNEKNLIYSHKKIKCLSDTDSYWGDGETSSIPIDILMRFGPQKPNGYHDKWVGLDNLRENGVEPVIDQLNSVLYHYKYKMRSTDIGPMGNTYIYWYLSAF